MNDNALALAQLAESLNTPLLVVGADARSLQQIKRNLDFIVVKKNLSIEQFPDWETLPFDAFSPHEDIVSQRLRVLESLGRWQQGIVLISIHTLMQRLCPTSFVRNQVLSLKTGQTLNIDAFKTQLTQAGYRSVSEVMSHGEFASRGSIFDIFPMGSNNPLRLDFFDNELDSLRYFDANTQRSGDGISEINLLPAHEYPLDDASIQHFREQWRETFSGNPLNCPIYQQISNGEAAAGVEYALPLFFDEMASLVDYLPEQSNTVFIGEIAEQAEQYWQQIQHRYEQLRYDSTHPLLKSEQVFSTPEETFTQLKQLKKHKLKHNYQSPPNLALQTKTKQPAERLKDWLSSYNKPVLLAAESLGRREVMAELLSNAGIEFNLIDSWSAFLTQTFGLHLCVAPFSDSVITDNFALISEADLLGEQIRTRASSSDSGVDPSLMIRHLSELHIGDPVVHLQFGIGRYRGLEIIQQHEQSTEYLTLEYADSDKIYVPISSLHLIHRYSGGNPELAPLHKLGSKQWDNAKKKALKRIHDVAADLLAMYAKREQATGHVFNKADSEFLLFKEAFPYQETLDQQRAINQIVDDMTSTRCMDRLLCGDVGFGKTEVAMQAAFLAAQGGKQVAVLVPTTLLATQHGQSFQDRFAEWPIRIAVLSRFNTAKQQQEILQEVAQGKVDIVIGTHALLGKQVTFKDLGLLIIDEEQRFGVRHKERIKALRNHVDILTMTATPIPRTLNFALSGMRDLSIISTPPAKRLSVKTFVQESKPAIIREAILREILRGGQVYFLHNDVATIQAQAEQLKDIVPEARIAIGHGQMRERELEKVMREFYHQQYNVLLATTIIESGIDIPTANTIIINRADKFGLAQLHQLRGRVGRSHHQAYAYLLTPHKSALSSDAKKRLAAIQELQELGSGFNLASHDLEIRGAGELLGESQSGQIDQIGYSLYLELLEEAVESLKQGKKLSVEHKLPEQVDIDLGVSALIPETYVRDVHLRLMLYKRLADCSSIGAIREFSAELIDRFGLQPLELKQLLAQAELRLQAEQCDVNNISAHTNFLSIEFKADTPHIDVKKLITLIQTKPKQYQLKGANVLCVNSEAIDEHQRVSAISELLRELALQ